MEMESKPAPVPKPRILAKVASSPGSTPPSDDAQGLGGVQLNISKKYVIPPRPKPGRKPVVDGSINRRKVQNREAQRAFRERRASAIQELERRLSEAARRHAEEQANLRAQVQRLERENTQLRTTQSPQFMPVHLSPSAMSPMSQISPPASQFTAMLSVSSPGTPNDLHMDILDRVLEQKLPVPNRQDNVSAASTPPTQPSTARRNSLSPRGRRNSLSPQGSGLDLVGSEWKTPAIPLGRRLPSLETDFTMRFKRQSYKRLSIPELSPPATTPPSMSASPSAAGGCCGDRSGDGQCCKTKGASGVTSSPSSSSAPVGQDEIIRRPDDRCGFCTDDTPCICAEAASRDTANFADLETLGGNVIPPVQASYSSFGGRLPSFSVLESGAAKSSIKRDWRSVPPGPEKSETVAVESPSPAKEVECTGNPGSCTQCMDDPMSTLFCTTIASKPGVAKTKRSSATFIPARAAYRTLSRHRHFRVADFTKVVDALETQGNQVEVNSVAKVLRMLDSQT